MPSPGRACELGRVDGKLRHVSSKSKQNHRLRRVVLLDTARSGRTVFRLHLSWHIWCGNIISGMNQTSITLWRWRYVTVAFVLANGVAKRNVNKNLTAGVPND